MTMVLHDSTLLARFLRRTPAWMCWIERARVGTDTCNYVKVSRPQWLKSKI